MVGMSTVADACSVEEIQHKTCGNVQKLLISVNSVYIYLKIRGSNLWT